MAHTHPLRCSCGALQGEVDRSLHINHGICYCEDCQAYAHFLGRADEILDRQGGTEVLQTTPSGVAFKQGVENLACMRLTAGGLMRWYAKCCNTPIGNTMANPKISFVGLVHNCLDNGGTTALHDAFGPPHMRVSTKFAKGEPKPKSAGVIGAVMRFSLTLLAARVSGSYKRTPFFDLSSMLPVATPKVLTGAELNAVMNAVRDPA